MGWGFIFYGVSLVKCGGFDIVICALAMGGGEVFVHGGLWSCVGWGLIFWLGV